MKHRLMDLKYDDTQPRLMRWTGYCSCRQLIIAAPSKVIANRWFNKHAKDNK